MKEGIQCRTIQREREDFFFFMVSFSADISPFVSFAKPSHLASPHLALASA